jgi:hypothetical protein
MKWTVLILFACLAVVGGGLVWACKPESDAVKTCRADAQAFSEEIASYDAEFDSFFGATTLAQRSTSNLSDRDEEIIGCVSTDPANGDEYRLLLYRNESVEANRFLRFVLDTKQAGDFAEWERGQQAAQLARYHRPEQ